MWAIHVRIQYERTQSDMHMTYSNNNSNKVNLNAASTCTTFVQLCSVCKPLLVQLFDQMLDKPIRPKIWTGFVRFILCLFCTPHRQKHTKHSPHLSRKHLINQRFQYPFLLIVVSNFLFVSVSSLHLCSLFKSDFYNSHISVFTFNYTKVHCKKWLLLTEF